MFAAITPALISGAVAERVKFSGYMLFIVLWSLLVYSPLAHWVWAEDGWIFGKGALDFAGGTVVHISSGAAALAFALTLGPRKGHKKEPMPPHNVPYTVLGAGILWFGWFGFNAGSAGPWDGAAGLASLAFVNTNAGAAAALMGWIIMEWIRNGKPTALGAASGAVAGLVAITPAAGYVTPMSALLIGLAGGVICQIAVSIRAKTGLDDSLDVVGVHFVGGTTGAILTGFLATKTVYHPGTTVAEAIPLGLVDGNSGQITTQIIAVVAAAAFSFIVSMILLQIVKLITGIRVNDEQETEGLDISQHGESAYEH
jgi:Amt family ammonium transporter